MCFHSDILYCPVCSWLLNSSHTFSTNTSVYLPCPDDHEVFPLVFLSDFSCVLAKTTMPVWSWYRINNIACVYSNKVRTSKLYVQICLPFLKVCLCYEGDLWQLRQAVDTWQDIFLFCWFSFLTILWTISSSSVHQTVGKVFGSGQCRVQTLRVCVILCPSPLSRSPVRTTPSVTSGRLETGPR